MYKMIIIDDQVKEIRGIEKVLDWGKLGIVIVGSARDGEEGIELALREKPDIIISDIVMRNMDGLQMIDIIKQSLPGVKVIFMSCFDDFKFANRAISQGVHGYVLKPILPGDLLKSINKTLESLGEERKNLELVLQKQKIDASITVLRENFYRNLVFGVFESEESILAQSKFLGIDISGKNYAIACIEIEKEDSEKVFFHAVSILEKLKQNFREYSGTYFILLDLMHIVTFFVQERNDKKIAKKELMQRTDDILNYINSECNSAVAIGVGYITENLCEVGVSYKQALKALQYKFYIGKQQVIDAEEVNFRFDGNDLDMENLNDQIKQIIFSGDRNLADHFVNSILSDKYNPNMLRYICYTIVNGIQMQMLQIQQNIENILGSYNTIIHRISHKSNLPELREVMKDYILQIIDFIEKNNNVENKEIARKMEDFIAANYHRPILLQDIAEYVYISPGYANFIFKNFFGKTVHQFIEELRLKRAVELLLKEKDLKVLAIAEMAGYCNSSYFTNVFKKSYGCTPSEYRKRYSL